MESKIVLDLLEAIDSKIFQLVLQLIIVGAIIIYIKDFNSRVVNYYKLKMSDLGRGTKIIFDRTAGYINKISFNEVEIETEDGGLMLIPVDKFIKSSKIIYMNNSRKKRK